MASISAVAIAAVLQIVLRTSVFIEQNNDMCSTAPTLASWIFLIAFLDILLDIAIYPVRYMHLPWICQFVAETIVTILLTEFGSLVVWCSIEKICCKLTKSLILTMGVSPDLYRNWESLILGASTTTTSFVILFYVGQATDHFYFLRKKSLRMSRKIQQSLSGFWKKLQSYFERKSSSNELNSSLNCANLEQENLLASEVLAQPRRYNMRRNRSRSRRN